MSASYAYQNLITAMDVLVGDGPLCDRLNTAHWEVTQSVNHVSATEHAELRTLMDDFLTLVSRQEGVTTIARLDGMNSDELRGLAKGVRRMYYLSILAHHGIKE